MPDLAKPILTRQEVEAEQKRKDAEKIAAEQRQAAADKAEADAKLAEENAKLQAEYDAQPRVRLQTILNGLHGNHFDVRDHLSVLTRALVEIVGTLHDAAPEAKPLAKRDDAVTEVPPRTAPPETIWPRQ